MAAGFSKRRDAGMTGHGFQQMEQGIFGRISKENRGVKRKGDQKKKRRAPGGWGEGWIF